MKVCCTLICLFFLLLQGGNTALDVGEAPIYTGTEGGNITVNCTFTVHGSKKFFCKQECKDGVLVQTAADKAKNGRYSIVYSEKPLLLFPVLRVSITQLTKSDSGRYRCGLDRWILDSHKEFEIIVIDASTTSKPNWTLRPFPASVPSASTPTTKPPSLSSVPGSFTPSSASSEASSSTQSVQLQTHRTAAPPAGREKLLSVGLILAVKIVLLSLAVLFFCRRRASKPKDPPADTEHASVSLTNRVQEDGREDRRSGSPPVEISTVYTCVKYSKPSGAETSDDYSSTAAASQCKAADDSRDPTYSEVRLLSAAAASLSVTRGNASDTVYSVLQVNTNSGVGNKEDAPPPLYSTVTSPLQ